MDKARLMDVLRDIAGGGVPSVSIGVMTIVTAILVTAAVWMFTGGSFGGSSGEKKPQKVIDCWEERRAAGVDTDSSSGSSSKLQNGDGGEKPFGSKYYYAHNDPKAKGGYKDGLKMEDYTMNEPRLLSSSDCSAGGDGGGALKESAPPGKEPAEVASSVSSEPTTDENKEEKKKKVVPIKEFQWEDPGNSKGIASIKVPHLPDPKGGGDTINFKDAKVVDTKATLEGDDSLLVEVKTDGDEDYELYIPKMYGRLSDVKASLCRSGKGLVVQVQKQNRYWDTENLSEWPHPQQKLHKAGGGKVVPITKYQWDDPGANTGICSIRIEELPRDQSSSSGTMAWKDANVSDYSATLTGQEELLIRVSTGSDMDYELHIPKLYGKVTEASAAVKGNKRLVVQLKKAIYYWDQDNLKAWPHPQFK